MSRLYKYFVMCWISQTVDESQLETAVSRSYITEEEYQQILKTPR